jgi:hypothetical protein
MFDSKAARAVQERSHMEALPIAAVSSDARQFADLAQDAARHAAELLRAEFALAKDEFLDDWQNAKNRAMSLALGALLLEAAIVILAQGVVLWLGATVTVVFTTGTVLAALGLIVALFGARALHSHVLINSRQRLVNDAISVVRKTNE